MISSFLNKHLDPSFQKRIDHLKQNNMNDFGVDPFGCDPNAILLFSPISLWFYRCYFRCEAFGVSHIPKGPLIVIANHAGQLPFDAWMLKMMFLVEPKTPRLLRGMAERMSADMPFISPLFARMGQVVGEPSICSALLKQGETVMVFPEGVGGIIKTYEKRYQLQAFGQGFLKLAIKHQVPILPIAIIGPEEQAPTPFHLNPLAKLLGLPSFPFVIPQIIPFPLPIQYTFHVGKPLDFSTDLKDIKQALQNLIQKGLKARKKYF